MSSRSKPRFDEIGYWSEVKLEIVRKYAQAYSMIMAGDGRFTYSYIDAFSGRGVHLSKETKQPVLGSPINALLIKPRFRNYYFIDLDGGKVAGLKKAVGDEPNVHILQGDCNQLLLKEVFPRIRYARYERALCLLDPYGLDLDWAIIEAAGRSKAIEIFLNFPIMDMNRNALWRAQDRVTEKSKGRMTAFWGDESWRAVAYREEPDLFGSRMEKQGNPTVVAGFRERLRNVAGFQYVPEPMPMRNRQGAVVYYLFFASPNRTGAKIVSEIFKKHGQRSS